MRGATQAARKLKQVLRRLRSSSGQVSRPAASDAITQLILGIFSRDAPEARAREALSRLRASVVDYNEMRVVPAIEMTQIVGQQNDARLKCEDLSRALNRIFAFEHTVSLERLEKLSKRDLLVFLAGIDGLDAYTRARMRLLGFARHAVPLDAAMWAYARKCGIVDAKCPLDEAQRFLERQISDQDALVFFTLFRKRAWTEMGAAVRRKEVAPIKSVPPDRTTRNMLQLIVHGGVITAPGKGPAAKASSAKPSDSGPAAPSVPKAGSRRTTTKRRTADTRSDRARSKPAGRTKAHASSAAKKPKRKPAARGKSAKKARRSPSKAKSA